MRRYLAFFFTVASSMGAVRAGEDPLKQWPHWRGPLATGVAPHALPPLRWDEKTNVRWKVALPGRGSATPIVWGQRVFVAAAFDTGRAARPEDLPKASGLAKLTPTGERKTKSPSSYHRFLLLCFERDSGKLLWQRLACERVPHEGIHPTHSYAAGSPTTDGTHVWVSFGSHGVYCFDFDGKLQWKRDDLPLLYTRYGWGEASTPVLHGNNLILAWDQEKDSRLFVLDAATGRTRFEIPRDEPTTWSTPLVVAHQGITQVIVHGTNRVRSYDLKTMKVLWECGGQTINAIPAPVADQDTVYVLSGYRGSYGVAIPLSARGDVTAKPMWKISKGTPYVPSPLLVDGKLYFTQDRDNLLTCLDARTGKPYFERQRLDQVSSFYSSPTGAAGRIYLADQQGTTLVLKQSTAIEVLAVNKLDDSFDASPVAVGRQLFLRGHKFLYCLEER